MNKHNAHEYLPLVQALAEGKTLQRVSRGDWIDCDSVGVIFGESPENYRIKPESKPRPFNNDELRQLWLDNVIIRNTVNKIEFRIERCFDGTVFFGNSWNSKDVLFDYYEIPPQPARPNGGICGVME